GGIHMVMWVRTALSNHPCQCLIWRPRRSAAMVLLAAFLGLAAWLAGQAALRAQADGNARGVLGQAPPGVGLPSLVPPGRSLARQMGTGPPRAQAQDGARQPATVAAAPPAAAVPPAPAVPVLPAGPLGWPLAPDPHLSPESRRYLQLNADPD